MIALRVAILASLLVIGACLECYSCKSSTDIDCAKKPGKQLDVQDCPAGDECVTAIINGITHRGCLTDVFPNKYCSNLCEKCNTSLCNIRIYPADRLRCYQCLGSSCIDVQNSTANLNIPMVCPIYKENDRCYTNVISENTVQRGCEATDLTNSNICSNICLKCNYDGCNNEIGVTQHNCITCSYIESMPSPDYSCLRSLNVSSDQCAVSETKTCYNKVLHGHKGKCFTWINYQQSVVNRGCSTAMGSTINGNLTECFGEYCNSECVNIMCNVCDTKTNSNCRNQTSSLKTEKCNSNSCFSCEEGEHLWRGCGSDLPLPQTNQICYQCRGSNGCNRQNIRSCYKCSSLNETNCASWADISNIPVSNCSHRDEKCVSTLVSRLNLVYTLRGCASQVSECTESDPFCDRCDGSLCNYGRKSGNPIVRESKYRYWTELYKMQENSSRHLKLANCFWYFIICTWVCTVIR